MKSGACLCVYLAEITDTAETAPSWDYTLAADTGGSFFAGDAALPSNYPIALC